eukprot:TRINITY_DN67601_c3_g10_i1.p1 TRINITY_DN67601_c3_g10~~TRINITY_DN67601_c3_g10_i1.p1  ORF type:complete len:231 (+),score=21.72 TRINITY_DN67601_c3_g10_i1:2-694(+)
MRRKMSRGLRLGVVLRAVGVVCALLGIFVLYVSLSADNLQSHWPGGQWRTNQTVDTATIFENKWLQLERHWVRTDDSSQVIPDWMWINYRDQVNVLVQKDDLFWVFQQRKYGLPSAGSLAVIGGFIENGETDIQAAHRELLEEMQLQTTKMVFLGKFRTDVNRGMGWVSCFLAVNCTKSATHKYSDDLEKQQVRKLTKSELHNALMSADFLEVKWSNTIAMSLLWLEQNG